MVRLEFLNAIDLHLKMQVYYAAHGMAERLLSRFVITHADKKLSTTIAIDQGVLKS